MTDNDDNNSNAEDKQADTTTEPVEPNGQAGLALSYDDDTLMA